MAESAGGDHVVGLHQPLCDLLHDGLIEGGDLGASLLVEGDYNALIARVEVLVLDDWILVVVDALDWLLLCFGRHWLLRFGGGSGGLRDDGIFSLRFQATQHLCTNMLFFGL